MSESQLQTTCSKTIATDLTHLTCTWQVVPVASALIEVGVPQLVPVDGSGVDVDTLAQQTKVDADMLYRYMRFVSSLGIFNELPNKHFAHNEESKQLLPGHLAFYHLLLISAAKGGMTGTELAAQLRDPSKSAVEHALKMPFYQIIAQTADMEKHFVKLMEIISSQVLPGLLQNITLPESGVVADVGGGNGQALLEFLTANPKLTGILYDLPSEAKMTEEGLKDPNPPNDSIYSKYTADVKKRVAVVRGSYTDSTQLKQIDNADVFLFKLIFHNNNDAVCREILSGLYKIMKPTATIFICDTVLKHTLNEWKTSISEDLMMSVLFCGKERSEDEWKQLVCSGEDYSFNISFGNCTSDHKLYEMGLIAITKKFIDV